MYTDVGTWYPSQACDYLHLIHRLHSPLERSLIEGVMEYFKDRTECFDDYHPRTKNNNCDLGHIYNWIKLFLHLYDAKIRNNIIFKIWR